MTLAITDDHRALHLPEEHGGAGYGLEELVVVVEQLGRAVAPGPFVPTAIASAVVAAAGDEATRAALLPRFAPLRQPDRAAEELAELTRAGVARARSIDLPPEAEPIRDDVRRFAETISGLDAAGQRERLIESGYVVPHWPKPWGREAGAVEQLVIERPPGGRRGAEGPAPRAT
jgi:Acyl-CoA dehydrogenase, N-terminal domain